MIRKEVKGHRIQVSVSIATSDGKQLIQVQSNEIAPGDFACCVVGVRDAIAATSSAIASKMAAYGTGIKSATEELEVAEAARMAAYDKVMAKEFPPKAT